MEENNKLGIGAAYSLFGVLIFIKHKPITIDADEIKIHPK